MSSQMVRFALFVCCCLLFQSGCQPSKYIDVSNEEKYKKIIGAEYVTSAEMKAIGVTFDPNYKKVIDYVYLVELPGFSGPEVIFSDKLNKGVKIKIIGVLASGNFYSNRIYYKVEVLNSEKYDNHIVVIYNTGDFESKNMGMNEAIFKKI